MKLDGGGGRWTLLGLEVRPGLLHLDGGFQPAVRSSRGLLMAALLNVCRCGVGAVLGKEHGGARWFDRAMAVAVASGAVSSRLELSELRLKVGMVVAVTGAVECLVALLCFRAFSFLFGCSILDLKFLYCSLLFLFFLSFLFSTPL